MYETQLDKSTNLLRIAYSGRVSADEAKQAAEQLRLLLPDLKPGFRLLADLTALELMDVASIPYIRLMMDLCNAGGVATIVRVIPDAHKDIGLNILSLFHYSDNVQIVTCKTLKEAMQALAA
jgi:hypothetical protein